MHCASCELLLQKEISALPWVTVEKISRSENTLLVDIWDPTLLSDIEKVIQELGYDTQKPLSKKSVLDWMILILLFIVVGIWGYLLSRQISFSWFLASSHASLLVVFLIGMIASVSSCLAITWGLVVGIGQWSATHKKNPIFPHLFFHLGRIGGFAILGGLLGVLGGIFGHLPWLNTLLLGLAGLVLVYLGGYILELLPSPTHFLPVPQKLSTLAFPKSMKIWTPLLIGGATFFLPCGFTQSMQIYASTSGSFLAGASIMAVFALGTFPMLFAFWLWSSKIFSIKIPILRMFLGVLVVYFWIFTLLWFSRFLTPTTHTPVSMETTAQHLVAVSASHDGSHLVPENIVLVWGDAYDLTITPESDGLGCMFALTIPWVDSWSYQIKKWVPIHLHITWMSKGTYPVICTAMGMKHGSITIQ